MKRSTIIGGLVFAVLIPAVAVVGISHTAKTGPEYVHALTYATQSPDVLADLGQPIADGPLPSIKWPMSSDKPTVNINMSLKGPNGKGTVVLTEVRDADGWHVTDATWYSGSRWKKLPLEANHESKRRPWE